MVSNLSGLISIARRHELVFDFSKISVHSNEFGARSFWLKGHQSSNMVHFHSYRQFKKKNSQTQAICIAPTTPLKGHNYDHFLRKDNGEKLLLIRTAGKQCSN